jgi:chorismate mutase
MDTLRNQINDIDEKLLSLLKQRFDLSKSIAEIKKNDKSIVLHDPVREKEIINNLKSKKIIDDVIVEEIWREILYLSKCVQKDIIDNNSLLK